MKHISLGKLSIPITQYASQGNAVLGIRDSGKSYSATYLAEQLYAADVPFVAFDPSGVWKFLRVPGKGPGLPVVVAGGKVPDLPLTPQSAPEIVRAAMRANVSLVLDLYDIHMSKADWSRIVESCVRVLLYENGEHGLRHIFIEEAAEFCLPMDTEVLTPDGWATADSLAEGKLVVGFDPQSATYQYEPIQRVIRRHHVGQMVPLRTSRLDALVTPDHRVVLKRWQHDSKRYKEYDWTFSPAADIPTAFFVPNGGAPIGAGIAGLDTATCRMLGWIITDGWWHSRTKQYISLEQSKATTKRGVNISTEMLRVFKGFGIAARTRAGRAPRIIGNNAVASASGESLVWFLGADLSRMLATILCGEIHRVPRDILLNGSREQLLALWEGLMEGDGTAAGGTWRYFYAGMNEGLADDVQELATKLAIRTIKRKVPQNGQWRLSIADQRHHYVRRRDPVDFQGEVWDITVPSGAFVARRNGTVFVTGNCPQQIAGDKAKVYAEVEKLARIGGNALLGYTLINQRAEQVNKAVLELCDCLFLHRQKGKNSVKSLEKWLELSQGGDVKEIVRGLPTLPTGECWVWPAGAEHATHVKMPQKQTFHPDRRALIANPAAANVQRVDATKFVTELRGSLEKYVEEAKANDPSELRKRIRELEREIDRLEQVAPDPKNVITAEQRGYERGLALGAEAQQALLSKLRLDFEDAQSQFSSRFLSVLNAARPTTSLESAPIIPRNIPAPVKHSDQFAKLRKSPIASRDSHERSASSNAELGAGGKRRILTALAQYPDGLTQRKLSILVDIAPKGGTWRTYMAELRGRGWMEGGKDLMRITDAGRSALGDFEPLPTGNALVEYWRQRLGDSGKRKIFDVIVAAHPNSISVEDVSEATSIAREGGTWRTYMAELRGLGIIEGRGELRASEDLF